MNIRKLKFNKENPFVEESIKKIQASIAKTYKSSLGNNRKAITKLVDVDTGEVIITSFLRVVAVDEQQFTKIYNKEFKTFFGLSSPALRVLGYLFTAMRPQSDTIDFNIDKCMEYTEYTYKSTIYRALGDLVEHKIIAKGPKETVWFINPTVIFNGDRVRFVKEYMRNKE